MNNKKLIKIKLENKSPIIAKKICDYQMPKNVYEMLFVVDTAAMDIKILSIFGTAYFCGSGKASASSLFGIKGKPF